MIIQTPFWHFNTTLRVEFAMFRIMDSSLMQCVTRTNMFFFISQYILHKFGIIQEVWNHIMCLSIDSKILQQPLKALGPYPLPLTFWCHSSTKWHQDKWIPEAYAYISPKESQYRHKKTILELDQIMFLNFPYVNAELETYGTCRVSQSSDFIRWPSQIRFFSKSSQVFLHCSEMATFPLLQNCFDYNVTVSVSYCQI